jgi:hypothetical protein
LGLLLSGFILVAGPWMIRNLFIFGSPLHQYTQYVLYCDNIEQSFAVNVPIPSLVSYLHSHGMFFTFLYRPAMGFVNMVREFSVSDHSLSLALLPFALIGLFVTRRHTKGVQFALLVFSVPYLALFSYTAYGFWVSRYLMVYHLMIYTFASAGILFVANIFRNRVLRLIMAFLILCIPLATVMYPLKYYLSGRGSEQVMDRNAREIIRKTITQVPDSAVVLSSFLSQYCFLHDMRVVNALQFGTKENFCSMAKAYHISHALLDSAADRRLFELIIESVGRNSLKRLQNEGPFSLYSISPEPILPEQVP